MRRKGMIGAAAVLVLVVAGAVVAATSGTGSHESGTITTGVAEPAFDSIGGGAVPGDAKLAAPDASRSSAAALGAGGTAAAPPVAGAGSVAAIDPAGPRIVRTADIAIEVGKGRFGGAFDRVNAIATSAGGYVTSSSTDTTGDDDRARSGQLVLRVPSERFEDVRAALSQVGRVDHQSLRGEDVSGQLVDYDARLRSLQAQEDSLRVLVGKATNVGEVLQVQNSLFSVRQQIEQLQAQRAQLDQAATLATIQVSLYEPGALVSEPRPEPATGLADSFERAVNGAVDVVGGMIVVLGYLAPLAVLGLLGWGGLRLRRRAAARGTAGTGTAGPSPAPAAT